MEIMSFSSSLFRFKKDLTNEVKKIIMERNNETSLGFQDEEGPCASYQQKKKPVLHRAPKQYTMPFSFEEEGKRHGDGGHLDHEILSEYLAEYKSQTNAFKENLTLPQFIHIKEERKPCSNSFLLPTSNGSSTCTTRSWGMKLDAFFLLHPVVERERGC